MHIGHLTNALIRHNAITQHLIPTPAPIAGANEITLREALTYTGFALLFREISTPGSHTEPTRKATTITVRWLVRVAILRIGFRFVLELCPTVHDEGVICRSLQEWRSNRNPNTVFARPVVAIIRRTLTGDGDPIVNSDEIFVVGWIRVTGIADTNTLRCK